MSIAVSAVVRPSRLLLFLIFGFSTLAFAIAAAIAADWFFHDIPVLARFMLAGACGSLGGFGFYHYAALRKNLHIDISGTGQIRVRVWRANDSCMDTNRPHVDDLADVVTLLPDSTFWPQLLLLRLKTTDGAVIVLPVLRDSVPRATFAALAGACRWIAQRQIGGVGPK